MSRHSIANVLTEFNVADNPVIFTVLCLITAADLLMICYNKFRGHRRVLRRGRDAVKRRKEARKAARDKAKSKSDEDATVLAERKRRKLEKMGENAKREEMEKEKKKHAKHPPIQDRVFLDLLDANMYTPVERKAQNNRASDYEAKDSPQSPGAGLKITPTSESKFCTPARRPGGVDALLADLLAPGAGLPAMQPDGPIIPWAELLQQRIRSGDRPTPGSAASTPCAMIQQRLPSRAQILARPDGGEYASPPSRRTRPDGGSLQPGSIRRRSTDPKFKSQRIPNCSAMLSGSRNAVGAPMRLEELKPSPGSVGLSPERPIQERITNLGIGSGSPKKLGGGPQSSPRFTSARLPLRTTAPGGLEGTAPTVAVDGTVSTRLPLRTVPSHGGLVLPPRPDQTQMAGALDSPGDAAGETPPPAGETPPIETLVRRGSAAPSAAPAAAEATEAVTEAVTEADSNPPSPQFFSSRLPKLPTRPAAEIAPPSVPPSPPDIPDKTLDGLLSAVSGALGDGGATDGSAAATGRPSLPKLRSTRLSMVMPIPADAASGDGSMTEVASPTRMKSTRLRMLPRPPPEAAATAVPGDGLAAISQPATLGGAPSVPPQSTRMRMMHKPTTADDAPAAAPVNPAQLRALTASLKAMCSPVDVTTKPKDGTKRPPDVAHGVPVPDDADEAAPAPERTSAAKKFKMLKFAQAPASAFKEAGEASKAKVLKLAHAAHLDDAGKSAAKAARLSVISAMRASGAKESGEELKGQMLALKDEAKAFKAELRDAFKSPKDFARFIRGIGRRGALRVKKFGYDFVQTARSEHTVANALAPPEEDVLGDSLQDEQIIHIFWTLVLAELCMINLLSENGSDSFAPLQIIYLGFITSMACAAVGKLLKEVFKFCNKKRRRQSMYDRFRRRYFKKKMDKKRKKLEAEKEKAEGGGQSDQKATGKAGESKGKASFDFSYAGISERLNVRKQLQKQAQAARYQERQSYLGPLEATFMPKKVERMRRDAERKAEGAVKIQAIIRRRQARKELLKRRQDGGYDRAAVALQAAQRRRTSRLSVIEKRKIKKEQNEAAITLQKVARGRNKRIEKKRQDEAARSMQKMQRSRMTRRKKKKKGLSGPSPPPSPPEGPDVAEAPSIRPNRFLQRLAPSSAAPPPADGIGLVAAAPLPAIPAGAAPAFCVAAPSASGARKCKFAAMLGKPAGGGDTSDSVAPAPAVTKDPVDTLKANPLKSNRFLAGLAAARSDEADAPAAAPAARGNAMLIKAFGGGAAGGAPAGAGAGGNKLLMKAFGGGGAAGAPAAGGAGDVFKSNRFLAQFASKVQGEEGDAPAGDAPAGMSRGKALWQRAKGVKVIARAKLSAEEADRIRRSKLVPFTRRYILLRWTTGWIINIVIFVVLWLVCFIYGVTFGETTMNSILLAWVAALVQTFLLVEPSEVLALVLIPSIADNACVVKCRTQLKDLGFI